jgi:hypothetical protein
MNELRQQVLAFRLADGYTPKSKLAGTEAIQAGMQIISQSQALQQSFGPMLPGMFSHLMQLMGVRGLEEYTPNAEQATQNQQQAIQNEQAASAGGQVQGTPAVQQQASTQPTGV